MTEYIKSLSGDFSGLNADQLIDELNNSGLSATCLMVFNKGDDVKINFSTPLDANDLLTMNNVITVHVPTTPKSEDVDTQKSFSDTPCSTSSTEFIDMPEMILTTKNNFELEYEITFHGKLSTLDNTTVVANIDGVDVDTETSRDTNGLVLYSYKHNVPIESGIVIKMRYKTESGTASFISRTLTINGI